MVRVTVIEPFAEARELHTASVVSLCEEEVLVVHSVTLRAVLTSSINDCLISGISAPTAIDSV